jgi:glycine hydroxymethyltransferase
VFESECSDLANWMCDICDDIKNESIADDVREKVKKLCAKFPVYR